MSSNRARDFLSLVNQIPGILIYPRGQRIYIEFRMDDPRILREIYVMLQALQSGHVPFSSNDATMSNAVLSITNDSFYSSDDMGLENLIRLLELFLYESDNDDNLLRILRDFLHRHDPGSTGSGSPLRLNEVLKAFYDNKKTFGIMEIRGNELDKNWSKLTDSALPTTSIPTFYDDFQWFEHKDVEKFIKNANFNNFQNLFHKLNSERNKSLKYTRRIQDKINITPVIRPHNISNRKNFVKSNPLASKWKFRTGVVSKVNSIKSSLPLHKKIKINQDKLANLLHQRI